MPRPSLLYVTPAVPTMTGGGLEIRSGAQIMALADYFDVSVAVATEAQAVDAEARIPSDVRAACSSLSIVTAESVIVGLLARAGTARNRMLIQAAWPLSLGHARVQVALKPLARAIAESHPARRFDVLHCYRVTTAPIMRMLRRRGLSWDRSVLDVDDYESFARDRYVRDFRHAIGRQYAAMSRLDAFKLHRAEQKYIPQFDNCYACSRADQAMLAARFPKVKWFVVPNVVAEPPPWSKVRGEPVTLLFVGSLDYGPNADGVRFLANDVLPILRKIAVAPFRMIVAGRRPGPDIRALCRNAGMELIADPPTLASWYAQSDAALVPIRYGAGTRIKLLEAFSFGIPVVSTEMGAEGLELEGERDLLFSNDADAFATACARLIADPSLRARLSGRGHELFRQRFSVESLRRLIPVLHGVQPSR